MAKPKYYIGKILHDKYEPFGIIKLKRNAKTKLNGKSLQPPESKL